MQIHRQHEQRLEIKKIKESMKRIAELEAENKKAAVEVEAKGKKAAKVKELVSGHIQTLEGTK
jgi:hypothetical protein